MAQCKIGAQLYINRGDTTAQIHDWVDLMADHGLSLIRLFMSWDLLEHSPGNWDFTQFDAVFEQAEKRGMEVVPTLMSVSPPGWMRSSTGSQDVGDLDDEDFWQAGLKYIDTVVTRYAGHHSLHSWIIWNEPARCLSKNNPNTMENFRKFLHDKYDYSIDEINAKYYQQIENFNQIGEVKESDNFTSELEFLSYAEDIDWLEFTVQDLEIKLRGIAERVRKIDTKHPLHINPHRISQCLSESGQSIFRQAHTVDFIGASVHPPWHSVRFPEHRIDQSVAMFSDYMRSATQDKDRKFWISELQAGPTIFSAFKSSGPRPVDLRHWIWEGIGSGAEAIMFWCFNNRNNGFEAGEWGLLNMQGKPSTRLKEVQAITQKIEESASLLSQCTPAKGKVGIVVSEENWNLALLEGDGDSLHNVRNTQMATDAVCGAYCMASDLGYEVEFIYEGNIADTSWREHIDVLLLPGCTALQGRTLSHIKNYVTAGGLLIADGLCAWKNGDGSLSNSGEQLEDIFGAQTEDVFGDSHGEIIYGDKRISHNLAQIAFTDNASCIARSNDGLSAVVAKDHTNNGRAIHIGTIFFQAYFMHYDSQLLQIFAEMIEGRVQRALQIKDNPSNIRVRELEHPEGSVFIVLNRGQSEKLRLAIADGYHVCDEHGKEVDTEAFTINQNEVRILALQNSVHTISSSN
ncbi:MAG: beta-galactosidase [Planctomycetes bacterium]|nr:beta-galactosidase [Planctomycetota bacterium]